MHKNNRIKMIEEFSKFHVLILRKWKSTMYSGRSLYNISIPFGIFSPTVLCLIKSSGNFKKKICHSLPYYFYTYLWAENTFFFFGQTLESAQRAGGMTSISSHCQHHIVGTLSPHLLVQSVKLCNANQNSFRVVFRFLISTFCILQRTIFFFLTQKFDSQNCFHEKKKYVLSLIFQVKNFII